MDFSPFSSASRPSSFLKAARRWTQKNQTATGFVPWCTLVVTGGFPTGYWMVSSSMARKTHLTMNSQHGGVQTLTTTPLLRDLMLALQCLWRLHSARHCNPRHLRRPGTWIQCSFHTQEKTCLVLEVEQTVWAYSISQAIRFQQNVEFSFAEGLCQRIWTWFHPGLGNKTHPQSNRCQRGVCFNKLLYLYQWQVHINKPSSVFLKIP